MRDFDIDLDLNLTILCYRLLVPMGQGVGISIFHPYLLLGKLDWELLVEDLAGG